MSLKSLLKRLIIEEVGECQSCKGQKPRLNEVDWEGDFSDVKSQCIKPEKLVEYLNQVVANAPLATKDRTKFSHALPFIHSKSEFFDIVPRREIEKQTGTKYRWTEENSAVDLDTFKKRITQSPNSIIGSNGKAEKTGGETEFRYNTGVPSFRGIIYDEKLDQFKYINTCPGATKKCRSVCYALKGNYIQYAAVYDGMTKRLNLLFNNPDEYKRRMLEELEEVCNFHQAYKGTKNLVFMRWNDSGDFFGKKYIWIAISVIKELRKKGYNIKDDVYTKLADVAKNPDFDKTKFSIGASKKQSDLVDFNEVGWADIYYPPKGEVYNMNTPSGLKNLKVLISQQYAMYNKDKPFKIEDIVTLDELKRIPETNTPRFVVVVPPNSSDDAAVREDVKGILNVIH
jgi:hypothetical protein